MFVKLGTAELPNTTAASIGDGCVCVFFDPDAAGCAAFVKWAYERQQLIRDGKAYRFVVPYAEGYEFIGDYEAAGANSRVFGKISAHASSSVFDTRLIDFGPDFDPERDAALAKTRTWPWTATGGFVDFCGAAFERERLLTMPKAFSGLSAVTEHAIDASLRLPAPVTVGVVAAVTASALHVAQNAVENALAALTRGNMPVLAAFKCAEYDRFEVLLDPRDAYFPPMINGVGSALAYDAVETIQWVLEACKDKRPPARTVEPRQSGCAFHRVSENEYDCVGEFKDGVATLPSCMSEKQYADAIAPVRVWREGGRVRAQKHAVPSMRTVEAFEYVGRNGIVRAASAREALVLWLNEAQQEAVKLLIERRTKKLHKDVRAFMSSLPAIIENFLASSKGGKQKMLQHYSPEGRRLIMTMPVGDMIYGPKQAYEDEDAAKFAPEIPLDVVVEHMHSHLQRLTPEQ